MAEGETQVVKRPRQRRKRPDVRAPVEVQAPERRQVLHVIRHGGRAATVHVERTEVRPEPTKLCAAMEEAEFLHILWAAAVLTHHPTWVSQAMVRVDGQ